MAFKHWLRHWKTLVVVLTPLLFLPILLCIPTQEAKCSYVLLIMSIYWMTEALPLAATAFIPIFGFPLLGVLSTNDVCQAYMKDTNMLFLGGLAVAVAVEFCMLHKRVALFVLIHVGHTPSKLLFGFILTTMLLSMWISNTAATAMMVPIVEAILEEIENKTMAEFKEEIADRKKHISNNTDTREGDSRDVNSYDVEEELLLKREESVKKTLKCTRDVMFLGVTYSSNLGGTGTITGTNPNLVLMGFLNTWYPWGTDINYASWLMYNVPGMLVSTCLSYIWLIIFLYLLVRKYEKISSSCSSSVKKLLEDKYADLGPVSYHEKCVISLFVLLVSLWFFRAPRVIKGWGTLLQDYLGTNVAISGASPAMLVVFLLFVIPKEPLWKRSSKGSIEPNFSPGCLTWEIVHEKLPWGVIILIGGGFAIAEAGNNSGLSKWVGAQFDSFQYVPFEVLVIVVAFMTSFLTEIMSNTASAAILLPVLKDVAIGMGKNPLFVLIPVTLCASYSFMLPVATPPNAIVFNAAKDMPISRMILAGFVMNSVSVLVMYGFINTFGVYMFDLYTFPPWANETLVNL